MAKIQPDGQSSFQTAIALLVLAIVALVLRFVAKRKRKLDMMVADWLIIAGSMGVVAIFAIYIRGLIDTGGTADALQMDFYQLKLAYKYNFIAQLLFIFDIAVIRFSIIAFYYDLFSPHKRFKRAMQALYLLNGAWFLVVFLLNTIRCKPIAAAWDLLTRLGGRKCNNYGAFIFGNELASLALDLAILGACISVVTQLQLSKIKAWMVCIIFALGAFVTVICIVRLYYFKKFTWNTTFEPTSTGPLFKWSGVQLSVAIVCSCIPCYGPLLPTQNIERYVRRWFLRSAR